MTTREIKISELHAVGQEGRCLLSLASLARVSFALEEKDGMQEAFFGGPNRLSIRTHKGDTVAPRGRGADVTGALKDLFSQVAKGNQVIRSLPPAHERGVGVVCRYKDGRFEI